MYTRFTLSFGRILKYALGLLLLSVAYSYLIYFLSDRYTLNISPAVPAVLGTAVSLLLGFRTNAAYNRWWEARKNWGVIIAGSRILTRQVLSFIPRNYSNYHSTVKRLVSLNIAFVYAHRNSLRHTGSSKDYEKYLDKADLNAIRSCNHKPNAILKQHALILGDHYREKVFDSIQFANMENTLNQLTESMGGNERIKNTVFPIQYDIFTRLAIIIYAMLFPFGIISQEAHGMILLTFMVVFFFILIDAIGSYLKDPFENRKSDTPISALCRSIEIDLSEMIEEKNLPPKLVAEKGILM